MADSGIKKITVPRSELPAIDKTNFTYNVRYRIVSEDKNRSSHWSKIYNLDASIDVDGNNIIPTFAVNVIKETFKDANNNNIKSVRASWTLLTGESPAAFDIFVKRKTLGVWSAYLYVGTAYTNTYTVFQTGTETDIQILAQTPTYPKEISTPAKLFETADINI